MRAAEKDRNLSLCDTEVNREYNSCLKRRECSSIATVVRNENTQPSPMNEQQVIDC